MNMSGLTEHEHYTLRTVSVVECIKLPVGKNRKPGHWLVGPLIGILLLGYRVRAVVEIGWPRHDDRSTLAEVMIGIISITPMTSLALIGQPIRR